MGKLGSSIYRYWKLLKLKTIKCYCSLSYPSNFDVNVDDIPNINRPQLPSDFVHINGEFKSILVGNLPWVGKDAKSIKKSPSDGYFDIYVR
jgi:hypothetical protein